ncbi:MAG: hypothetical protein GY711_29125 [bacterium]|nr:hypothetical protein [bacterium]
MPLWSRFRIAALCLFGAGCVSSSNSFIPTTPQRPFTFPNLRTAPEGAVELEIGADVDRGERFEVPTTVRTGLTEASEVFASWSPYGQVDLPGDDGYGSGDLFLGYRESVGIVADGRATAGYQVEAKLAIADDDKELGTGEHDLFGSGILMGKRGDVEWHATYRLGAIGDPGGGFELQHGLGLTAAVPLTRPWVGIAEIADLETPGIDRRELTVLVGVRYVYASSLVFDTAFIAGLSDDAPDVQFRFGLSAHLGRRR